MVRQARPIRRSTTQLSKPVDERPRVLYIDDEAHALFLFTELFRNTYEVLTASCGEEGIEILERRPDIPVIVTDQKMPGMTGIEFFEKIVPDFPYPTRIILTGYTEVQDIIAAINTGRVYQYITKPWDEDQLWVAIDRAVEHYRLTMSNKRLLAEKTNLLENMGDGLIAIDADGVIRTANPQAKALLGLEVSFPFPANALQALAEFPLLTALIERTLRERKAHPHQEITLNRRHLLVSSSLIHLPDQPAPTGAQCCVRRVCRVRTRTSSFWRRRRWHNSPTGSSRSWRPVVLRRRSRRPAACSS